MASTAALDLIVQLKGNADKEMKTLSKEADTLGKSVEGVGKKGDGIFSKLGSSITSMINPMALAGAGALALGGFLAGAAKSAMEEQVGIDRLNQTLKNNGFGAAAKDVEKYIAKTEKLAFADDELRDSLGYLITATGDLKKAQDLQNTAMDLARAKNISLEAASKLVGKVDADNIGILKRYGIAVTENMTKEEALAAVRKATAGQAEAYAKTTEGAFTRIQNTFGNIVEDVGGKILSVIEGPLQGFADFLQGEEFAGVLEVVGGLLGTLGKGFEVVGGAVGGFLELIGVKQKDATTNTETFEKAYAELMGKTAQSATDASNKVGTEFPTGFKTAADGAIGEMDRVATKAETPITIETVFAVPKNTDSLGREIEAAAGTVDVTLPIAPMLTVAEGVIDGVELANRIELLAQQGLNQEQITLSLTTITPIFDQLTLPDGSTKDLSDEIEALYQQGMSAEEINLALNLKYIINPGKAQQSLADTQTEINRMLEQISAAREVQVMIDPKLLYAGGEQATQAEIQKFADNLRFKTFATMQIAGQGVNEGIVAGINATKDIPLAPIGAVIDAVISLAKQKLEEQSPSQVFHRIGSDIDQGLANGITANQGAATSAMTAVTNAVLGIARTALTIANYSPFGSNVSTGIQSGINGSAALATGAASSLATNVKDKVAAADDGAFGIGQNVSTGIANGINSMAQRAATAAANMVTRAINAAKSALAIDSPSKVFYEMGGDVDVGFAQGITAHGQQVQDATLKMVDERVVNVARARINALFKKLPEDDVAAIRASGEAAGREWGYGFDPSVDLCDPIETASAAAEECGHSGGAAAAQAWIDGFNDRMASGEVNVGPYQSGSAYDPGNYGGGSGGSGRRAMAAGGAFWTNGPTNLLVGEAGREFVSVTPAGQTAPGGLHIGQVTVYAGMGANGQQIANDFIDELRIRLHQAESLNRPNGQKVWG